DGAGPSRRPYDLEHPARLSAERRGTGAPALSGAGQRHPLHSKKKKRGHRAGKEGWGQALESKKRGERGGGSGSRLTLCPAQAGRGLVASAGATDHRAVGPQEVPGGPHGTTAPRAHGRGSTRCMVGSQLPYASACATPATRIRSAASWWSRSTI